MDWKSLVHPVTGPKGAAGGSFGTGFVVGHDAHGAALLVTCWHVVRDIVIDTLALDPHATTPEGIARALAAADKPCLQLAGNKDLVCTLVSSPGDDDLDLAVLRVPRLPPGPELRLAAQARGGLEFETLGYGSRRSRLGGRMLLGRPLVGTLDTATWAPRPPGDPLKNWDYYLGPERPALAEVEGGYSGAPVFDARADRVVAVIAWAAGGDKGFAIDIEALPEVYPGAKGWLASGPEDGQATHDYHREPDAPLAKLLDHRHQLAVIQPLLDDPQADRHLILVDACADHDRAELLADRLLLHPWPEDHQKAPRHRYLDLVPNDPHAVWNALVDAAPGGREARSDAERRERVRDWVGERGRLVLYAPVLVRKHGPVLRKLLRRARQDLHPETLGAFPAGGRLLILLVCMPEGSGPPFWWPWLDRLLLRRLPGITRTPALALLSRKDVDLWHDQFPLCDRFDRDSLREELLELFKHPPRAHIPYDEAWTCLVGRPLGTGALSRARRPD